MDLFNAIRANNVEEFKRLLDQGANVNSIDSNDNNYTPLHCAILKGNTDIVEELLRPKWRVDVNAQNSNGDTALHLAALKEREDFIHLLWERNAVSNIKNNDELTFIHVIKKQAVLASTSGVEDFYEKLNERHEIATQCEFYSNYFVFQKNAPFLITIIH